MARHARRRFLATLSAALAAGVATAAARTALPQALPMRRILAGGERLPAVGLGTWRGFDVQRGSAGWDHARATLARFHALGGTVVDSSPMYGAAEAAAGAMSAELGINPSLFLASKVWTDGEESGMAQLDASLALMRRQRMDLMQVHNLRDLDTQLATLRRARDERRVRMVGVSHYHAGAHPALERVLRGQALDVVQLNYSIAEPEAAERLLPLALDRGVAVFVNRPFGEGALLRRVRGRPLPPVATELGAASWAQLLLKWILAEPAVTVVLAGTRNPAHVEDNLAATRGPLPDHAQRAAIAAAALAA